MSIPPEAIIATLDDGTLVCWLGNLPEGTKFKHTHGAGAEQTVLAHGLSFAYPGQAVFVQPEPDTPEVGWYNGRAVAAYDVIPNGSTIQTAVVNGEAFIKAGDTDIVSGQLVYVHRWPDGTKPERLVNITEDELEVILDALEECRTDARFTAYVPALIDTLNQRAFPGLAKLLNTPTVFDDLADEDVSKRTVNKTHKSDTHKRIVSKSNRSTVFAGGVLGTTAVHERTGPVQDGHLVVDTDDRYKTHYVAYACAVGNGPRVPVYNSTVGVPNASEAGVTCGNCRRTKAFKRIFGTTKYSVVLMDGETVIDEEGPFNSKSAALAFIEGNRKYGCYSVRTIHNYGAQS